MFFQMDVDLAVSRQMAIQGSEHFTLRLPERPNKRHHATGPQDGRGTAPSGTAPADTGTGADLSAPTTTTAAASKVSAEPSVVDIARTLIRAEPTTAQTEAELALVHQPLDVQALLKDARPTLGTSCLLRVCVCVCVGGSHCWLGGNECVRTLGRPCPRGCS